MIVTNAHNVPPEILNAAKNDKYSKGLADISVTTLIDAPQISVLRDKHKDELTIDVADRMWALLGTAVHSLLENANEGCITEERLFTQEAGLTISGAIDIQEPLPDGTVRIRDYKVCPVTAVQYGKKSWHEQLNMYALLVRRNKAVQVTSLQICAILRDWKRSDRLRDSRYPDSPIVVVDIPIWSDEEQERYFEERAALHYRALYYGEDIPCTADERWERGEKWAIMKSPKAKRATRTFTTEAEAVAMADATGYIVEHRSGTCTRCEQDYCQVARFCKQWEEIRGQYTTEGTDDDGWL